MAHLALGSHGLCHMVFLDGLCSFQLTIWGPSHATSLVTHVERSVKQMFLDICGHYPLIQGGFLTKPISQCLSAKGRVKEGVQGILGEEAFLGVLSVLIKEKEKRGRDCGIVCIKHQSVIHSSHFSCTVWKLWGSIIIPAFQMRKWDSERRSGFANTQSY